MTDTLDVNLKWARLGQLADNPAFLFQKIELSDFEAVTQLFKQHHFNDVIHSQIGDVQDTHADISDLVAAIDYTPRVSIDEGVRRFVDWYTNHYEL